MPLTGYAQALKQKGKYPLKPTLRWKQREKKHPVTPYLVIPNYPGDMGQRPLDKTHDANCSFGIETVDKTTKNPVAPLLKQTYLLQCRVLNFGAVACYAGIAEFYATTRSAIDLFAKGAGPRPAPLGYAGFVVPPGKEAVAVCQRTWTFTELTSAILVRAYDPIADMCQSSYNYVADRHVARRDLLLLDQVNAPEWKGGAVNIVPVNHVSQTFVPTLPTLVAVEIGLRTGNAGRGGDTVTMSIFCQGKQIFSRSTAIPEGFEGFLHFDVTPPLAVDVGKTLTMEVHDTGKDVFHWKYCGGNTYGRGNALFCGKSFDTNDFYFKTFGEK